MRYDLAALIRRARNPRRSQIILRPILPPAVLATNLYQRVYRRIIAALEAAAARAVDAYAATPMRDGLTTDAVDDFAGMFDDLGDILTRLFVELEPAIREWALQVERWERGKWRGAVLTATGVDLETILLAGGTPQAVGEYIAWNVALVRDISEQGRARISQEVFAAFQARLPARDLAAALREAVGLSRKRAQRVASDQLSKLSAALDRERQTDAGIDRFKWRHSGKRHPRKEHLAHNGQVYAWAEPPQIKGKPDIPGHLPFCGCRAQAVIDLG